MAAKTANATVRTGIDRKAVVVRRVSGTFPGYAVVACLAARAKIGACVIETEHRRAQKVWAMTSDTSSRHASECPVATGLMALLTRNGGVTSVQGKTCVAMRFDPGALTEIVEFVAAIAL
jgi:hypothetical protein